MPKLNYLPLHYWYMLFLTLVQLAQSSTVGPSEDDTGDQSLAIGTHKNGDLQL